MMLFILKLNPTSSLLMLDFHQDHYKMSFHYWLELKKKKEEEEETYICMDMFVCVSHRHFKL